MSFKAENTYSILHYEAFTPSELSLQDVLLASSLDLKIKKVSRLSEALVQLRQSVFDVVFIEWDQVDDEAVEVVTTVTALVKLGRVILIGSSASEEVYSSIIEAGASDYFERQELNTTLVNRAIKYWGSGNQDLLLTNPPFDHSELCRIFNLLSDCVLVLRKDYTIRFLNRAAAVLLESDSDTLVGEVFPFNLEDGSTGPIEIFGPHGTARVFEVEVSDYHGLSESSLLVILRDVTLNSRATKEIARDDARLSILLESIKSGVIMTDEKGGVQRMNSEASRLTGLTIDNSKGRSLEETLWVKHPRTGRRVHNFDEVFLSENYLKDPPPEGVELTSRDGQIFNVRFSMKKTDDSTFGHANMIVVVRDVSFERDTQVDRHELEKLNAMNILASGIGHDFNNILSAVMGNISVARLGVDKSDKVYEHLTLAEKATLQARGLTQQLISFAKGGLPNLESTELRSLVEDCSQFILRGSNVRCDLTIADDLWPVEIDAGRVSQVINNLIINADQAMPNGGIVEIKLCNKSLKAGDHIELSEGDYVHMSVCDYGPGIRTEDLPRIFDPYFTTKEHGNGLGLASCQSIIKSLSGAITVESALGAGSTFNVYLPRAEKEAEIKESEETEAELELPSGGGRILIMDDMEAMMMVAGEIIKALGYEVEFSTNGQEAIDSYLEAMQAGNPFDAVVFDLTVPGGMGGYEACQELLKHDPDLVAIASSGYTNSNVMEDYEASGFKAVVPKPYRIKEMSDALNRVLKQDSNL